MSDNLASFFLGDPISREVGRWPCHTATIASYHSHRGVLCVCECGCTRRCRWLAYDSIRCAASSSSTKVTLRQIQPEGAQTQTHSTFRHSTRAQGLMFRMDTLRRTTLVYGHGHFGSRKHSILPQNDLAAPEDV